jgi:phage replication O-like protein O
MKNEVNSFQVPNALIDELICDLTGVELKIYLLIVRKTKGWHKEKEAISINDFCQILKISNRHIIKGCNSLIEKGLIKAIKKDKKTTVFSIQYYDKKSQDEPAKLMTKSHKFFNKRSQDTYDKKSQDEPIIKTNIKDTFKDNIFLIPKIDEINDYIKEKKLNVNSETFFFFYESIGWKVGNKPMKDWRASLRYWNSTNRKTNKSDEVVERFFI